MENQNRKTKELSDYLIIDSSQKAQHIESKVTQKYTRSLYDDNKGKNSARAKFKEKAFQRNGKSYKSTKDRYTGEDILKSHKAADKKYKSKASTHKAETDHITPLKNIHNSAKNMNYITDSDIKLASNRKYNLVEISKKTNSQKKDSTNFEYFKKHSELSLEAKTRMLADGVISKSLVTSELIAKDLLNAGIDGTINGIGSGFQANSAINLSAVIQGEKSVPEAMVDTIADTVKCGVISAKTTIDIEAVTFATKNMAKLTASMETELSEELAKKFGKEIAESNLHKLVGDTVSKSLNFIGNNVGNIVSTAALVGESCINYIDGEINEEEFLLEVGSKAVAIVSMEIGKEIGGYIGFILGSGFPILGQCLCAVAGEIIGSAVGYLVGSLVIGTIIEQRQREKMNSQRMSLINKYCNEAINVMEKKQYELKNMITFQFKQWDTTFDKGFEEIFESALSNDTEGIAQGLDKILNVFGESVRFKTLSEFRTFFEDKKSVLSL